MSDGDPKSLSQERFARFAPGYVQSQSHARGYDLDRLVEIASPQPDWQVLDIATGGGHTALKFAPFVARVLATDLTPRMLEAARDFAAKQGINNVQFEPADAEDLPFDVASFDLVTCRIAPHHFPNCARFIQEGARVLRSGGTLLVQDHVLPDDETAARYIDTFERLRDPSHHRAFSHKEWTHMFVQAGLTVTHTEEIVKRHVLIPWAVRQDNSPEVIGELRDMLDASPTIAADWLEVESPDTPKTSFINHHILIAGRK